MGSFVCCISSTVPTCLTRPSYSMAMRLPTRYALRMSCVMTTLVTPNFSRMRIISSSITALVTGSRPVVGSSYRMYFGRSATARAIPHALPHAARQLGGILLLHVGEVDQFQRLGH